jgi:hypothetical protein
MKGMIHEFVGHVFGQLDLPVPGKRRNRRSGIVPKPHLRLPDKPGLTLKCPNLRAAHEAEVSF